MTDSPLVDLGEAVLAAVVGHWPALPDAGLPDLAELPARQYVTIGAPTSDCEQLVVSIERTFGTQGNPAIEQVVTINSGVPWLRAMVVGIQILRCVAVVDVAAGEPVFPAASVIQAEAAGFLTDADTILQCLIAAHAAGELGGCGEIALENWRAISPEGGFAGGTTRLRLNLF